MANRFVAVGENEIRRTNKQKDKQTQTEIRITFGNMLECNFSNTIFFIATIVKST